MDATWSKLCASFFLIPLDETTTAIKFNEPVGKKLKGLKDKVGGL